MSKTLETVLFLSMDGETKEAIEFYKKHFDAKVEMLVTYETISKIDPSFVVPKEKKGLISHSVIRVGNTKLMLAENTMDPNEIYRKGNNFSMCIQSANKKEIEGFYNSLIDDKNVKIIVPLAKNIFSEAYGIVEDPFGIQIQLMYDNRLK